MGHQFYVVGIGASAGGHRALQEFFSTIPANTGAAFVVVTHLLRGHQSMLPRILTKYTAMPVKRIASTEIVRRNLVYVMPEGVKLVIRNSELILEQRPADEAINNSIDVFFESLARERKENAIGVILSGMGSDGAAGALALHEHGGTVLVQDPSSTQFPSMPWSAIMKDHPEEVLTPAQLGKYVSALVHAKTQIQQR
jgi:two-component system, chemotaxis family, protein-glutamate methylesterase/glutaminase